MISNDGNLGMHDNRHKYFRWTPRTAWITIVYVVIVPSVIGTIAYRTDVSSYPASGITKAQLRYKGKYDLRGKLRGDAITKF